MRAALPYVVAAILFGLALWFALGHPLYPAN
jgi:hypothetical protein